MPLSKADREELAEAFLRDAELDSDPALALSLTDIDKLIERRFSSLTAGEGVKFQSTENVHDFHDSRE